jgi:hypothetical protein
MGMVATIILLGLLAGASVAAARLRHRVAPRCPPGNEGVMAAGAQVVVYKAGTSVYEPEEHKFEEGPEEIFGCAHRAKRPYRLGPPLYGSATSGNGGVGSITLAGPIVAYDVGEVPGMEALSNRRSVHEIWVRNLRTGKLIHRVPNGSPAELGDVGLGDTTEIVVKSDGSVAWIVRAGDTLGGIQVRSVDKTGSHLLAASSEIDPDSLALAGSTLYWMQGGKPMSAVLN